MPTPPLPAETVTLTGPHQMVPNLLFEPVANVREAPARVADRKVLHPAPQYPVDWHWQVRARLGYDDPPSYIQLLVRELTGIELDPGWVIR